MKRTLIFLPLVTVLAVGGCGKQPANDAGTPKPDAVQAPKTTAGNTNESAGAPKADSRAAQDKVVLTTSTNPVITGTPVPVEIPNLEPESKSAPTDFMVPRGTVNLALKKKVTSSDSEPVLGTLDLITDGDKEGDEGSWVELGPGKQWVQIDLEKTAAIYAVYVWHFHSQKRAYRDVVAQVSDDPKFEKGVTTIFNADAQNNFGFGPGKDMAYVETNKGKLIDAKGVKGRYVRLYSNGNTSNKLNHYIEVEVFGIPAA